MKITLFCIITASVFGASVPLASAAPSINVGAIKCDGGTNPLGVDMAHPELSWILESPKRGEAQAGYQVLVASTSELLAANKTDLWDSGQVKSDDSQHVHYAGKPLGSSKQVFWKVRVWGNGDKEPSAWSSNATWTVGVVNDSDWKARWISATGAVAGDVPSPLLGLSGSSVVSTPTVTGSSTAPSGFESLLLRREFNVNPGLRRAVVNVCGLGQYEMTVDGKKVGDDLLTPGWSNYRRTCLYDSYDITSMLKAGPNAAGLLLGNGMYNVIKGRYTKFLGSVGPQKVIGQIRLEYKNGRVETYGTDDHWKVASGPITFSSIYGGEDFDARLVQKGWDKPGFDDSKWVPAIMVDGPGGLLKGRSCSAPPIRAFDVLTPVKVTQIKPGVSVYDLGQNASQMVRITVSGPAGSSVKITPAELLKLDGTVDRGSVGGGKAYWNYTLSGAGEESYFPKFFYHGCRYLQVETAAADGATEPLPIIKSLEGVVVHSASTPVGEFATSSELFNRIHTLVRWAQRSNMVSLMTDCPTRERLGWLEEDHLNGPSLRYEFDLAQLFRKQMNDMADSQLEDGFVPNIAPEYVVFGKGETGIFRNSPEWGSAFLLVAWQQYEFTGSTDLLRRHYDAMKRYVAYLGSKAQGNIVNFGLGDWYDIGPKRPGVAQLTPIPLTATAFYYADVEVLSKAARALGNDADAKHYESLAGEIREAFNAKFFDSTKGQYSTGSQTANAIPLVMELAKSDDPTRRQSVLDSLVKDIRDRGNALTAGDVGYRYLLRALADGGRSDVIFDINNQSEKPGYGLQLARGATSLTEAWDALPTSSQNHFMLGQIMEWFYHDLSGIQCDMSDLNGAGFKKIAIKPAIVGDLTWVKASYISGYGKITSSWKHEGKDVSLDVTIPVNTTATVYVPAKSAAEVTEGGKSIDKADGVKFLKMEKDTAVFSIGSGSYSFKSQL